MCDWLPYRWHACRCLSRFCLDLLEVQNTCRNISNLAMMFVFNSTNYGKSILFDQACKYHWHSCCQPGSENIVIFSKIYRICSYIAKIIWNLLPNNSMCVCALHIKWSTLVIHTALLWRGAVWHKLSNTEKMPRAQVISQQNMRTENQNIVTMCHIKKIF